LPGGSVSHWVIAPFHGAHECLSKIIPFGERSLRRAMKDYIAHYHTERNHQGKNNLLLFHRINKTDHDKPVRCRDRLGGLLRYYHQEAA
jgi:putative transposase